ncbi:hypothetical protein AN958_05795 [Leucoagaricus sp. SymC.cos]|nr:hypothetical protein AN958_05795 [Leucoagaricus sp. SymC.cos]
MHMPPLHGWGGLEEIVTDNGTLFVTALKQLAKKYHI